MPKFKYTFELSSVFNEEFSRWFMYECFNAASWNTETITYNKSVYCRKHWRISQQINYKILIESNQRLFSIRKGLEVNCEKQTVLIG